MKKIMILSFVLLSAGGAWADWSNGPFFPTGTTWTEAWIMTGETKGELPASTFEVGTDTLINDISYKRILVDGKECGRWLREEKQQVWLLRDDFPQEIMLYNFKWVNANNQYYKTNIRQYIQHGELREDTFYIDKNRAVYLESENDNDIETYIQFEYFDYDAVEMLRGIGMVEEPYKDCCILGCVLPDEMEPATGQYRLMTFNRHGKLVYDYKNQFTKHELFTRNYPPTAGLDVWFYSLLDGIVRGDYVCLDSIRENRVYLSVHYNGGTGTDKWEHVVKLGSFEAGEHVIVLSAIDDSGLMPSVVNEIPFTVKENTVGASCGFFWLTKEPKDGNKDVLLTADYVTDITASLENDSLHITGWLNYSSFTEPFCYYEVHGDSVYLETAEKWGSVMVTTIRTTFYPLDLKIPFHEDHCTIEVAEYYERHYTKEGYFANHFFHNTFTFDFTSVRLPEGNNTISSGTLYDLTGRPTDGTKKGIYIKNGKKVLVK